MIGVEDSWIVEINGDEISGDELFELRIIDEAGLALPTLELAINTKDEKKIQKYTVPGYKIEIGLGKKTIEEVMEFQVFKKVTSEGVSGSGYWHMRLWCVLNQIKYLDEQQMIAYETTDSPKRSNEVWTEVVSRYDFTPDTTAFKDKMLWLQYNISDRRFLEELTWHGFYNANDPCLYTLRRDSKARYLPFSQLKTVKGIIGNSADYDYPSNYFEFTQNDGFLSVWGGGERITPMHTLEEGTDDEVDKLDRQSVKVEQQILKKGVREEAKKYTEYQFLNDNVHSNWWRAYEQNRILRSSMGAINIEFHFPVYHKIFPLDYFKIQWNKQRTAAEGSEMVIPVGGDWLAVGSQLMITKGQYQQKLKLSREQLME